MMSLTEGTECSFHPFSVHIVSYVDLFAWGCYRCSAVPGGGPGLEGINGGGEPMPISGSWVKRKPCRGHKCHSNHQIKHPD